MKKCKKCNDEKSDLDFHKDKSTVDGLTSWCADCRQKATEKWLKTENGRESHKNTERLRRALNPEKVILELAKARAKKLGLEFNITIDDIKIPQICPVLKIPIIIGGSKMTSNSPTLDRFNNQFGYVKGNVNVISWRANRLKSDATPNEIHLVLCYMMGGTAKRPKGSYAVSREFNGKIQTLEEWAAEYNMSTATLNNRISRLKWTFEKSLLTPVNKKSRKIEKN